MVLNSGMNIIQAARGKSIYAPKLYINQYVSHFHSLIFQNGIAKLPAEKAPAERSRRPVNIVRFIIRDLKTSQEIIGLRVKTITLYNNNKNKDI